MQNKNKTGSETVSHQDTKLNVHNIRGDMLYTAAIGIDQHSEGKFKLSALLQHLQHVGQGTQKRLQIIRT